MAIRASVVIGVCRVLKLRVCTWTAVCHRSHWCPAGLGELICASPPGIVHSTAQTTLMYKVLSRNFKPTLVFSHHLWDSGLASTRRRLTAQSFGCSIALSTYLYIILSPHHAAGDAVDHRTSHHIYFVRDTIWIRHYHTVNVVRAIVGYIDSSELWALQTLNFEHPSHLYFCLIALSCDLIVSCRNRLLYFTSTSLFIAETILSPDHSDPPKSQVGQFTCRYHVA